MGRQTIRWTKNNIDQAGGTASDIGVLNSLCRTIISVLTFGLLHSRKSRPKSKVEAHINAPPRISLAFQFERAAQVVESAVTRAEAIQSLHRETVQQLDATEYALHRLFDEIHSVLPRFEKPIYQHAVVRTGEAEPFRPTALAA